MNPSLQRKITCLSFLIFSFLLVNTVSALYTADICGVALGNEKPTPFPIRNLHLFLDGGVLNVQTGIDGTFCFRNVASGVHLIEASVSTSQPIPQVYSTFKVQVPTSDNEVIKVLEYRHPGAIKLISSYPLEIRPVANAILFDERPQSSIFSLLLNPQV